MCAQFVEGMEYVFRNWKPRKPFGLYTSDDYVGNKMLDGKSMGFEIPTIDMSAITTKLKETEAKLAKL